jgi:hypothetical protein
MASAAREHAVTVVAGTVIDFPMPDLSIVTLR